MKTNQYLISIYNRLLEFFGPRRWWPAKTPFEMMVGAVLTQAVAWRNVQTAITNLEQAGLMDPFKIIEASNDELELLLRPTRYFRMKAKKLRSLAEFMVINYQGDIQKMFLEEPLALRSKMLKVYGMGAETVDSILLYAGEVPIFVVDQYTRRIFSRLGLVSEQISYQELQAFFMRQLPSDSELYNEFHALIDGLGNKVCHLTPRCSECPITDFCRDFTEPKGNLDDFKKRDPQKDIKPSMIGKKSIKQQSRMLVKEEIKK